MSVEVDNFIKLCPNCGSNQYYNSKNSYNRAIKSNSYCNKCSITHTKRILDDNLIKEIIELYNNGNSYTKISGIYNIDKVQIKRLLLDNNIWVGGRDILKKNFSNGEIETIKKLYVVDNLSCEKIGTVFNISKAPIKNLLKDIGILRKGVSDGIKINLTEEQENKIKDMYLNRYNNCREISLEIGLDKQIINNYLKNNSLIRTFSESNSISAVLKRNVDYITYLKKLPEFKKYKKEVMIETRKQNIKTLNFFNFRGVAGINGAYHLDHKYSIVEGFKNNISSKIIGNINNLEFIPWEKNIKKGSNCSITLSNLITLI